ncbi:BTB/POZ domain-containing protein At2g04740 [Impatiens glandulifera]|uniref:BTB/POZ domain-containing protein At2g04740 n=1 Tax=Impatiens glandulifera TaxID=253017 RepID=UPI001FB0A052|nr:BTB/POZ domain-containing protein At2g04740 [Impatiens glandulifera]
MSMPRSWTIDPYLEEIDLEPEDFGSSNPLKKVPFGDVFEAARAGDVDRLSYLLESGVNVNARDQWDSVALYYACLAGHLDAARMLLESGAICSEHTFDGDRCHYASLNLKVRKLLKAFEARPPPLAPLQSALRETFLNCSANRKHIEQFKQSALPGASLNESPISSHFPPDFVFYVQGSPIEAHRVILSARSPYFKNKFENEWKDRMEVRFSREKLSYQALYSLIHFFYSDRLEIAVEDMEDLVRICKVCKCESLRMIIEKELIHQKFADYKALQQIDNSQKRFILQGLSLPEEDRLPGALNKILQVSLANSSSEEYDLADVCVKVDYKIFRCHQVVLASRSDYFKARLSHMKDFLEGRDSIGNNSLPCIEENDLSVDAFEKMVEYMYTDGLKEIDPNQAEEIFDAASRYLLFPLKRAAADVLLPHLEMVSPAEMCSWLILSDMYGVVKIREYCLDAIACNFETFAEAPEFRALLLTIPPPSGDSSLRTTAPSAPGTGTNNDLGNLLDDLREKWLEIEAAELDKRDESALLFDKRLEMLVVVAEKEKLVDDVGKLTI